MGLKKKDEKPQEEVKAKVKTVERKEYTVKTAYNFGTGLIPEGGKVKLSKEAAEHYKFKNII